VFLLKKWWKRVIWAGAGCCALGALYVGWQYHSIVSYADSARPVKSDAIIVLGAEVRGVEPSPALAERCEWAYELYEQGYAPKLILSGAQGNGRISEAQAMKNVLEKRGVPAAAMLLEEGSHSTRENLANSQAIMQREGLKTAIIATHRFHQKRAALLAEQLGLTATCYGETSPSMFEPYWTLRETAAILKTYAGR
jgi:uncharacterized SAM-binding protein YcdF (DUF218 family)